MSVFKSMILAFLLLQVANSTQIYFLPYEQKEAFSALIKEISSAKHSINVAIYSFTNREIAKALRDAQNRGVAVTIIYDFESNYKKSNSTLPYLAKLRNVYACTLKGRKASSGNYNGIMHHKMAIIDGSRVLLGSANWSKNAFENNFENFIIIDGAKEPEVLRKAQDAYKKMLSECGKY